MIDLLLENSGAASWIGHYIVLPLLIFVARILDVTLGTLRVLFIMQGNQRLAPVLGFVESMIWLMAISQIMLNLENPASYVAFAGGYAFGTYVGIKIEERLAIGKVLVRVIIRFGASALLRFLKDHDFHYTNVPGEGRFGKVNILFFVIKRERLPFILKAINEFNPKAFYTVEAIKSASEYHLGSTDKRFLFFNRSLSNRK